MLTKTGKKLYSKRFSKSYLYAFSDGTIQVGKGNALTQLTLFKSKEYSVWLMEIRKMVFTKKTIMYPHDNIFNIYYNIGKRTPFLVKRCELGLARASSEERRIDPNRDRTFLVETVKPRGKYGKAYGKCFVDGKPDDSYRQECYPNIKNEEIPCAGCGEWVLIDVPGVSLDDIFPIHKAKDILMFGKYKGKSFSEIYKIDYQYLHWLETTDRFFKIDFEELKQLYPNVENPSNVPITEKIIDFGKYKGKKFGDIKDDTAYLEWFVSIGKISIEEFKLLTTKLLNIK